MKKSVKTFEEFIGMEGIEKYKKQNRTWQEDDVAVSPGLNTNDPSRHYDDEYDGKDQINRSVIGKRA
jgi:hypothetical protein